MPQSSWKPFSHRSAYIGSQLSQEAFTAYNTYDSLPLHFYDLILLILSLFRPFYIELEVVTEPLKPQTMLTADIIF